MASWQPNSMQQAANDNCRTAGHCTQLRQLANQLRPSLYECQETKTLDIFSIGDGFLHTALLLQLTRLLLSTAIVEIHVFHILDV